MLILILQNINFELKQCIYIKTLVLTYSHHALNDIKSHGEVLSMMREQIKKKNEKHTKKPFPLYHVVQIFNVLFGRRSRR